MKTLTSEQLDQFARVLGDLLRSARKERGWTRKQMRAEMGADEEDEMSLQTLATYELGTRRMSIERLVELCAVLEQQPDQLLLRAITLAFGGDHDGRVKVDLSTLARTTDPQTAAPPAMGDRPCPPVPGRTRSRRRTRRPRGDRTCRDRRILHVRPRASPA